MRSVTESNVETGQSRTKRRLEAMGIRARMMPGSRCVVASMHCTGRPLDSLTGSLPIDEIVFSTAGVDRIKCMRPRALFALPLIRIADCTTASMLEARIRATWSTHMAELRAAEAWLRDLGADVNASSDGSILSVSISGEDQNTKVQVCRPREVILPGSGPLSGIALSRPSDRLLEVDPCVDSAVDLEIEISNRLSELASLDRRLKDEQRREFIARPVPSQIDDTPQADRPLRVLLVGDKLSKQRSCIDSLRLRNYEVATARTLNEAIHYYGSMSPELIFVDVSLGRSEGIDLIPSLRNVVGIEEIPIILVDEQRNTSRRFAAQRAGATGYLTYPIDVSRIASQIEKSIKQPKRRRFTRYAQQLAVHIQGASRPSTAVVIGRGGMMLRTDEDLSVSSIQSCNLLLPATGTRLEFEAEVVYRVRESGHHGIGLRFESISEQHEAALIDYLHRLH